MFLLHWTPEGHVLKLGLNLYATRTAPIWFRVVWHWYDTATYSIYGWYFRFRWQISPHFIWEGRREASVIASYIFEHDLTLLTHEQYLELKGAKK